MLTRGNWLGVDVGGTQTKSVVVTDGEIGEFESTPTARTGPADTVAGLVAVVADRLRRRPDIDGVGITLPGTFDEEGRAQVIPNLPGTWAGTAVREPVALAAGRPVTLINDARAFGLAEATLGAARGVRTAVGLVVGTGVGGVVVLDGCLHLGADGGAGEIGHQVLEPDGPPCGCGNRGCVESFTRADVIAAAAGQPDVASAALAAADGDERAVGAFVAAGQRLGHGLANVVTVLRPEVVFVGGGVATAGALILEPMRQRLVELTTLVSPTSYRLVAAELGTGAGAIGAALAASAPLTELAPVDASIEAGT